MMVLSDNWTFMNERYEWFSKSAFLPMLTQLSLMNPQVCLLGVCDWIIIQRMVLKVLNCSGCTLTRTLSQRNVCQIDVSVSLHDERFSFYGQVGSWFLSSPGTRTLFCEGKLWDYLWRINICFVALLSFFSVYCVCLCALLGARRH